MTRFQFAACEWAFPCWGDLAVKMAHEAGFTGVQLGDGGGSMQGFPLRNKRVQDYYLNIAVKYGMSYPQIHLYTFRTSGILQKQAKEQRRTHMQREHQARHHSRVGDGGAFA